MSLEFKKKLQNLCDDVNYPKDIPKPLSQEQVVQQNLQYVKDSLTLYSAVRISGGKGVGASTNACDKQNTLLYADLPMSI